MRACDYDTVHDLEHRTLIAYRPSHFSAPIRIQGFPRTEISSSDRSPRLDQLAGGIIEHLLFRQLLTWICHHSL
ncbi:hypothetical protein RB195_000582 [Necator americanus]|uniref:Uncharacterized protein n=1 Tax=Necator americanus TaxID=51031 RepID=A0ABR1DAF0_NECAM